ncbi:MAG: putative archaeal flagellar protein D/E [uncultured archaeon A07HB70]|nr:MAG: putative archaeal flagellar protein D/E [uncultured archaeon A07HB70]
MFESITQVLGDESEDEGDEPGAPPAEPEELAGSEAPGRPNGGMQGPEGPAATELSSRIDELEDDIESTTTSLGEIQNTQRETMESVEEVNETVRRLAGIYDQVAASQNPFVDDGADQSPAEGTPVVDESARADERHDATDAPGDESGAAAESDPVSFDDPDPTPDASDTGPAAENGSVSFDDLGSAAETPDDAASGGHANGESGGAEGAAEPASADEYVLESVPEGYAAELLMMEWLSRLIQRSGPAGAFRAVEQYHDLGMISSATRDHAIDLIGGPSLDVFVDPTESDEPSVEEHRVSSAYLRALDRLTE